MIPVGHRAHGVIEVGNGEIGADRRHTRGPRHAQHVQATRSHAGLRDRGQVVAKCRQSLAPAEGRQPVHEPVGGAVIDLSRVAQRRGDGGEQHEVVEGAASGRAMEIKGATRLGCEYLGQRFGRQVRQQAIVQYAREMEDALQRTLQPGDTAPHVRLFRNVARDDVDLHLFREIPQRTGLPDPVGTAAALRVTVQQREMARACGRQIGQ